MVFKSKVFKTSSSFKPIPITEAETPWFFMTFSIKMPHIFLSADKMSLGHLILNRGIKNVFSVFKTDNDTNILIRNGVSNSKPDKSLNTLKVRFLDVSESQTVPICPRPSV